jgi:hypothetical protein
MSKLMVKIGLWRANRIRVLGSRDQVLYPTTYCLHSLTPFQMSEMAKKAQYDACTILSLISLSLAVLHVP